jgi:hypothetical protein
MSLLPKLNIKLPSQNVAEETCSLEQMEFRFNWGHEPFLIVVEGQTIGSYEQLKELAQQDCFKDREFLEVEVKNIIIGG